MRSTMILAALAAILTLTTAPAMAEMTLLEILDSKTVTPAGNSWVNDIHADSLDDLVDSYWLSTASQGSVATMIIELSANDGVNTFGLFDRTDPTNRVIVFDGASTAGTDSGSATVYFQAGGVVKVSKLIEGLVDEAVFGSAQFGFFLQTPSNVWYSDSLLNADNGADHLLVFQGNNSDVLQIGTGNPGVWTDNEFILAWEDWTDFDYQDFVVMVESVLPVPVPGAVLLGVLGLGAAGMRLRKRQS